MDYYSDVLNLTLTDFVRPDVSKIAENNDRIELGRLLQLILGKQKNNKHILCVNMYHLFFVFYSPFSYRMCCKLYTKTRLYYANNGFRRITST